MNNMLLYGSLAVLTFIQALAMLITIKALISKNGDGQSVKTELIVAVPIAVIGALLCWLGVSDFAALMVQAVCVAAFAFYRYARDWQKVVFYTFFYTVVIAFLNFAVIVLSGIISGDTAVMQMTKAEYGGLQLGLMFAVRIILLALGLLFYRAELTDKQNNKIMGAVGVLGLLGAVTLSHQKTIVIPDDTIFTWLVFFAVIIASFILFNLRNQYELEKELVRMRETEKELLQREYAILNNAYSTNARMFHDFHNHIGILRQLLISDGQEKALAYLNELSEPMDAIASTVWTGDATIDYLVNSKMAVAGAAHIRTEVNVEFPGRTNIRAHDLCAILGNLLDNALEACGGVQNESNRFMTLTIRRINNMLIIKLRNSASHEPRFGDNGLESTKEDSDMHGWGIKSIQAAADKYDGVIQTDYENHVFQAVVSLSFEGVEITE